MSATGFVPDDFEPPRALALSEFHLVPLGTEHKSPTTPRGCRASPHIRATPGFESTNWTPLCAAVSRWLAERWPFGRVAYADRAA